MMTFDESDRYWAAKLDRHAREALKGVEFRRQLRLAQAEGLLRQLLEDAGIRLDRYRLGNLRTAVGRWLTK